MSTGCSPTPDRASPRRGSRSEEHTSELQSRLHLVCRLLLEKKKTISFSKLSPRSLSSVPTPVTPASSNCETSCHERNSSEWRCNITFRCGNIPHSVWLRHF